MPSPLDGVPMNFRYTLFMRHIEAADNDPENTMFVALTHRNLATIVALCIVGTRVLPEADPFVEELFEKFVDVGEFQEFLPRHDPSSEG